MKVKRDLSGIYFRYLNPDTKHVENRCFEDLPEDKQDEILNSEDPAFAVRLVKTLANTLNDIGTAFDLTTQKPTNEG